MSQPLVFVDPKFLSRRSKKLKSSVNCLTPKLLEHGNSKDLTPSSCEEDLYDNAGQILMENPQQNVCQFRLAGDFISKRQCIEVDNCGYSLLQRHSVCSAAKNCRGKFCGLQNPNVRQDVTVYKELGDRMERVATTASSLKAEQDSDRTHKFLMYPRFIQLCLNKQRRLLQPHTRTYAAHSLTNKVFNNMKRVSRGYTGVDTALFPTMLVQGQTLEGVESTTTLSTSQPPSTTLIPTPETHQSTYSSPTMPTSHEAEEPVTMPHDSPIPRVHTLGRDEGSMTLSELMVLCTNLSTKVTSLETKLAQTKQTYGSALTKLIKKKTIGDTEILQQEEEPTELVEDFGSGEKGNEVSTATTERQVYTRRSAGRRKDKGKAIMKEEEPVQKKSKKQLEQERLSYKESIRLQEQTNEEKRQQIARDADIAK
ncbi:hypothetical protein Tco_1346811 [Tanacetum coccineum]